MTAIAKNNAFGAGSPSWNLSFPDGNLTAAEILAYLPHWLKSVDVILRLVEHGGRSVVITHLLNKYRIMPSKDFQPNSTTVMVQYAMRRTGRKNWSIGTRNDFPNDRTYDEDSIYVGDFRAPRLTHPKSASLKHKLKKEHLARNCAADPVPFKDLALHVKEHPTGTDALDLTRCVLHAVKHPKENWLFPTDFKALVMHIGGPRPVTHSHLDRQLFGRYNHLYSAHDSARPTTNWNRGKGRRKRRPEDTEAETNSDGTSHDEADIASETDTNVKVKVWPDSEFKPQGEKGSKTTVKNRPTYKRRIIRQARSIAMAGADGKINGSQDGSGKRRSSCRIKKAVVYTENDEYGADDVDSFDADYTTPGKKRRIRRIPPTPEDEESDFEAKEEPESEDDIFATIDDAADEDFGAPTAARGRRLACRTARQKIEEQSPAIIMEQFRTAQAAAKPAHISAHNIFIEYDPQIMTAARAWESRKPFYIPAPTLSRDRLVIDAYTLPLYAQEGCRNEGEMWASALSFYRFGGPRRHAPFRELYRLTEPYQWDTSDWAENVRWAKEQYKFFSATTWTEYDDHLEYITQIRRQMLWVSEDVVMAGVW